MYISQQRRLNGNTGAARKNQISAQLIIFRTNKRKILLKKHWEYNRKQMFYWSRSTTRKYSRFFSLVLIAFSIYFDFQIVFFHLISQLLLMKQNIGNSNMTYINYSNEKLKRIRIRKYNVVYGTGMKIVGKSIEMLHWKYDKTANTQLPQNH